MDTGLGKFTEVSEPKAKQIGDVFRKDNPERDLSGIFRVGEVLEIRGSKFRVEKIKTRGLRLLLLPKTG